MKHTLIIKSIGTANPGIARVIADAFQINHDMLIKQLYNAPAVFLENAEFEIIEKAAALLNQLGLEVEIFNENEKLPERSEPVDIAVYIKNPLEINKVSKELSHFLGCKDNEAMALLLNEPSVVLGGVSLATAETLQKRLDAEVMASNPKKDLYTILLLSEDDKLNGEIKEVLKQKEAQIIKEKMITDISYTTAREIWQRYQHSKKISLHNQSYQRFEIVLQEFDLEQSSQTEFLTEQIGMPEESLQIIFENLPVVLDEAINQNEANGKMELYAQAGLVCKLNPIPFGKYKLRVENITNPRKFEDIVAGFYNGVKLESDLNRWTAPLPLDSILNRFLAKQLEFIGCETSQVYENNLS